MSTPTAFRSAAPIVKPLPYQVPWLAKLEAARQSGSKVESLVLATGLGKTIISALDLRAQLERKPGRVLFLCHDRRILRGSEKKYRQVLGDGYTYGSFHGSKKNWHKVDILFATFQTMATWRENFACDEFMYIIIDEIHHAQAATFRPTVEYFKPEWLLGLTATLERGDGLDVTELFGNKPPLVEMGLFEALARGYLCDVDYRIMTDEIMSTGAIETPVGKLSIKELNRTLFVPKRDEEIVRVIQKECAKIKNPRTMIFCTTIKHAEDTAALIPGAVVLHSKLKQKGPNGQDDNLEKFYSGEAHTVVSVNSLNEGIDVPECNIVVFLRTTDSKTIFLQQFGRGLRWVLDKVVVVLDFVGNCERIEMIDDLQQGVKDAQDILVDNGAPRSEGTIRPHFTLSIDNVRFEERSWDLLGKIREIRERSSKVYTKEELTAQLLTKAKVLGRTPKGKEVKADPKMASVDTFRSIFGTTWNGVLKAVGLTVRQNYTVEALTVQLKAKAKELGRTPTSIEVDADPKMASTPAFMNVFNTTWNGVLKAVGLEVVKRRDYTVDELTVQLKAKAKELGRTPAYREVDVDPKMASVSAFLKVFGTNWLGVLSEVGLETRERYTVQELTEQLLSKAAELGRRPTSTEVNADPKMASVNAFVGAFDTSWINVLSKVGLDADLQKVYSKKELTEQLLAKANKLGRTPSSTEVKSDPEMASVDTFRNVFGTTWNGVLEEIGLPRAKLGRRKKD